MMFYVRTISFKRVIGALSRHTLLIIFFVSATWSNPATAISIQQSKILKSRIQTAPLPQGNDTVKVQWLKTTYQQIDPDYVRVQLNGKAQPRVIIQLQPGTVAINSHLSVQNQSIRKMAPSSKEITVGSNGRFSLSLTLPYGHVQIPFRASKPPLLAQPYVLILSLNQSKLKTHPVKHKLVKKAEKNQIANKHSRWNFGFSARSIAYSQTNLNKLSETSIAGNILYRQTLANHWTFKARSLLDLVTTTPFSTASNQMSARFFGLGADLIYLISIHPQKWSVAIAGGVYYSTMLPSGMNFGYTNLWEPELFPVLTYSPDNKNAFDAYLRYAPVDSQFNLSFASHELNGGIGWTRTYRNRRSLSLNLSYRQVNLLQNEISIKINAVSLGISYGVP